MKSPGKGSGLFESSEVKRALRKIWCGKSVCSSASQPFHTQGCFSANICDGIRKGIKL